MRSAPANIRQAAAEATLQFDWLLPAGVEMLKVAQLAAATGMKTTFLEEYFAEKCHRYPNGSEKRPPMRIPRAFAVAFLVKSAKYDAQSKFDEVASLAREFSREDCLRMAQVFLNQANRPSR